MKQQLIYMSLLIAVLYACSSERKQWTKTSTISLEGITPIGLAESEGNIWISDGDHNRLLAIDKIGNIVQTLEEFERPMHIASDAGTVFIPEYGSDSIIKLQGETRSTLSIQDSLDAPAGVDVKGDEVAIADFYNHRILYANGDEWISFGEEGNKKGEFYYPTDVQLTADKIYVADAYNNRVQVFDKKGNFLQLIGVEDVMNAATGLFVSDSQVIVTDFEHDRVLVYDLDGTLEQIIEDLQKPTDVLVIDGALYIANYKGQNLEVYN